MSKTKQKKAKKHKPKKASSRHQPPRGLSKKLKPYATQLHAGIQKLKLGEVREGITLVNSALDHLPPNRETLNEYATILANLNLSKEHAGVMRRIARYFPNDVSIIRTQVNANIAEFNLYRAYKDLHRGLASNPNDQRLLLTKAKLYMAAGRFADALDILNGQFNKPPYQPDITELIAQAYYFNNQSDKGLAAYQKLIQVIPSFTYCYKAILFSMCHGQLAEAAQFINELLNVAETSIHKKLALEFYQQLRYLSIANKLPVPESYQTPTADSCDILFISTNALTENGGGHPSPQVARCLDAQGHRILFAQRYTFTAQEDESFPTFHDPFLMWAQQRASDYIKTTYRTLIQKAFPQTSRPRKRIALFSTTSTYANSLIPMLKEEGFTIAYWCIDDWQGINNQLMPKRIEASLARQCQATAATAKPLSKKMSAITGQSSPTISNGFSPINFPLEQAPRSVPKDMVLGEKTFIYWGGINLPWVDWEFMYQVMAAKPTWQFNFIGPFQPQGCDTPAYLASRRLANAHFLGSKSVNKLYDYGINADIALLHFKQTKAAKSMNHIKVYEYLACGLPIIATHIAAMTNIPAMTEVDSVDAFTEAVQQFEATPPNRDTILGYLADKTWDYSANQLLEHFANR